MCQQIQTRGGSRMHKYIANYRLVSQFLGKTLDWEWRQAKITFNIIAYFFLWWYFFYLLDHFYFTCNITFNWYRWHYVCYLWVFLCVTADILVVWDWLHLSFHYTFFSFYFLWSTLQCRSLIRKSDIRKSGYKKGTGRVPAEVLFVIT
jgi:hypothetical protein